MFYNGIKLDIKGVCIGRAKVGGVYTYFWIQHYINGEKVGTPTKTHVTDLWAAIKFGENIENLTVNGDKVVKKAGYPDIKDITDILNKTVSSLPDGSPAKSLYVSKKRQ